MSPRQRGVLLPDGQKTEQPEGVHPAPLVGVGQQEGAETPGGEDGEGGHVLGGRW